MSATERSGAGEVRVTGRLELGGMLTVYGAAECDSGRTCMLPYCSAAISCGERGLDLRLSFWRRF